MLHTNWTASLDHDTPQSARAAAYPDHHPVHSAEGLTAGGNLAYIQLGDQTYTLRITRAGKLILTK
ncbi:MAG: hemin uptake protein HemP [Paracoccaceae bacterium]